MKVEYNLEFDTRINSQMYLKSQKIQNIVFNSIWLTFTTAAIFGKIGVCPKKSKPKV